MVIVVMYILFSFKLKLGNNCIISTVVDLVPCVFDILENKTHKLKPLDPSKTSSKWNQSKFIQKIWKS